MTLYWDCITPGCGASGTTTGTESGQDAKHSRAENHTTVSHAAEWGQREEGS